MALNMQYLDLKRKIRDIRMLAIQGIAKLVPDILVHRFLH